MGKQSSKDIVTCFDEVLLRLPIPNGERILKTREPGGNIGGTNFSDVKI